MTPKKRFILVNQNIQYDCMILIPEQMTLMSRFVLVKTKLYSTTSAVLSLSFVSIKISETGSHIIHYLFSIFYLIYIVKASVGESFNSLRCGVL